MGTIKKRSRDERGLVEKGEDALSLPDPARRTSPGCIFDKPH